MPESHAIASRLAAASQWFPLPHNDIDGRAVADSTVYVEVEGDVIAATVTDYDGSKREYRAAVQLISGGQPVEFLDLSTVTAADVVSAANRAGIKASALLEYLQTPQATAATVACRSEPTQHTHSERKS